MEIITKNDSIRFGKTSWRSLLYVALVRGILRSPHTEKCQMNWCERTLNHLYIV